MEVYILGIKNKSVITKESLINIILDKSKDDFISAEDLIKLIDKARAYAGEQPSPSGDKKAWGWT